MMKTIVLFSIFAVVAFAIGPLQSAVAEQNNVSGSNGVIMIDKRGGLVRFFDSETLQEISYIDLGVGPHELVISPDHKTAYVPKIR
jgi:DNA-binding beta-propeller fold protein YncE